MGSLPTGRDVVETDATPELMVPVPRLVLPLVKTTVPVAVVGTVR